MNDFSQPFTPFRHAMWAPFREIAATPQKRGGSIEERLARLESETAVRDLFSKYVYCYDGSDLDGTMSVFHNDCTLVNPRGTYIGLAAIRRNYDFLISGRKFSFHHVSNPVVRLEDGAREGGLTVYFNCVTVFRSGYLSGGSGTYAMRVINTAEGWKVVECRITMNARHSLDATATGELVPSSSPDAHPPAPAPNSPENSRDWIGPDALAL